MGAHDVQLSVQLVFSITNSFLVHPETSKPLSVFFWIDTAHHPCCSIILPLSTDQGRRSPNIRAQDLSLVYRYLFASKGRDKQVRSPAETAVLFF